MLVYFLAKGFLYVCWSCLLQLTDPLKRAFVFSLALFLPLILSCRTREGVFVVTPADSQTLSTTLVSTTAMTAPLFIDMALDAFSMKEVPYLGQRFLSTLVLALGNGTALLYFESSSVNLVLVSCFVWSYFLDFSISISSLHSLSELPSTRSLTVGRVIAHLALFVFFAFALLSVTDEGGGQVAEVLAVTGLAVFAALLLVKAYLMFKTHYLAFAGSEMSVMEWYKQNGMCFFVQIRILGLVAQVVALFIVLFALGTRVRGSQGILQSSDLPALLVVRCVFFMFDYFLSSRIFRSQIIKSRHECTFKTEMIKYFSHEMRSPLMGISATLELLEDAVEVLKRQGLAKLDPICDNLFDSRRCCFLALEILDNLLLYGKIDSGGLTLSLQQFKPLKGVRQMFLEYTFVAQGLNIGVFIRHNPAETLGLKRRLDLDLAALKNVFGPLLRSLAKKVLDPTPRRVFDTGPSSHGSPEIVTECLVEGSMGDTPNTNDICLNVAIGGIFDVYESAIRARMKFGRSEASVKYTSSAALWLHIEIIDDNGNISLADIEMMNGGSPDFSRKG